MARQHSHESGGTFPARGDWHENVHHERQSSEDYSLNSSSTDSTRPTVHTKHTAASMSEGEPGGMMGSPPNSFGPIASASSGVDSVVGSHNTYQHQNKANQRKRVPGGAAAKLMFRGPPAKSAESSDASCHSSQCDSQDDGPVDTSEIFDMINRAKAEYETGPNKARSSPVTMVGDEIEVSFHFNDQVSPSEDDHTEGTVPHILNREEAYHENASAAVAAILNPTRREDASMTSGMTDGFSTYSTSRLSTGGASAFQSPKYGDIVSEGSTGSNEDYRFEKSLPRSPTSVPLISGATEAKLDRMSQRMLDPSKTLSDLLRAIASPEDITQLDRPYMVRRKNACGALKVLTAHNRRRKQICWTVGVLPALTSVLQDAGEERLELTYPDVRTRSEYEEARRRAIAALTNLAMPVPNRLAVFHTPGLIQALISVVSREDGECLEGACAILAYLAKSNENKILMAQVPGLFEAVLRVLRPQMNEDQECQTSLKRKEYPWTSSASESESSVSSGEEEEEGEDEEDEEASILSGSTDMSSDGETYDDEEDDAEFTDDDMSTDHESMTGSEGSCDSSMSESSGEDSGSDYFPEPSKASTKSKKHPNKARHGSRTKPLSPLSTSRTKLHSNYDKDKHITAARKNLFAMLGHLAKEKDNAVRSFDIFCPDKCQHLSATHQPISL